MLLKRKHVFLHLLFSYNLMSSNFIDPDYVKYSCNKINMFVLLWCGVGKKLANV